MSLIWLQITHLNSCQSIFCWKLLYLSGFPSYRYWALNFSLIFKISEAYKPLYFYIWVYFHVFFLWECLIFYWYWLNILSFQKQNTYTYKGIYIFKWASNIEKRKYSNGKLKVFRIDIQSGFLIVQTYAHLVYTFAFLVIVHIYVTCKIKHMNHMKHMNYPTLLTMKEILFCFNTFKEQGSFMSNPNFL